MLDLASIKTSTPSTTTPTNTTPTTTTPTTTTATTTTTLTKTFRKFSTNPGENINFSWPEGISSIMTKVEMAQDFHLSM